MLEPSRTCVAVDCLCECVDIAQNFAAGTGHDAVTTTLVAPGPMLMSSLYVTYASVSV